MLVGVEMDWLADRTAEIAAFLDGRPFDVVLGSVHFIDGRAIDDPTADDRDWLARGGAVDRATSSSSPPPPAPGSTT